MSFYRHEDRWEKAYTLPWMDDFSPWRKNFWRKWWRIWAAKADAAPIPVITFCMVCLTFLQCLVWDSPNCCWRYMSECIWWADIWWRWWSEGGKGGWCCHIARIIYAAQKGLDSSSESKQMINNQLTRLNNWFGFSRLQLSLKPSFDCFRHVHNLLICRSFYSATWAEVEFCYRLALKRIQSCEY